jgi:hypothetical protein
MRMSQSTRSNRVPLEPLERFGAIGRLLDRRPRELRHLADREREDPAHHDRVVDDQDARLGWQLLSEQPE